MKRLAWLRRNRLFILLAITYSYFYQGSDPNQSSRLFLTRAMVERGDVEITPDHPKTIDKAERNGRFYSDKGPGISGLAAVPYVIMNAADRLFGLDTHSRPVERVRLHMLVISISVLAGVLSAYFLHGVLRLLGASASQAGLLTFGYGVGTLVFPFSTVLFGHVVAAAALVASFFLMLRWRAAGQQPSGGGCAALGFLWALSVVVEYPTALLAALLGLYLLSFDARPRAIARSAGFALAGAAVPLVLHGLYLWRAFGSPLHFPYQYVYEPMFRAHQTSGFLGIGMPTWTGLFGALLSRYRGLFFYCPFLILTFAGLGSWLRAREWGREAALCTAVIGTFIVFCISYYAWDGGGSTGPRHLVPALPFFVLAILFFYRRGRWARWCTVAVLVPSVIIMTLSTAVLVHQPEGDPHRMNPLYGMVVPSLMRHEISLNTQDIDVLNARQDASYNLGSLLGLPVWISLMVPAALWCAAYAPTLLRSREAT